MHQGQIGRSGVKTALGKSWLIKSRLMYGTDHPFFPPLEDGDKEWLSVTLNAKAVRTVTSKDSAKSDAIMGGNAIRILGLET